MEHIYLNREARLGLRVNATKSREYSILSCSRFLMCGACVYIHALVELFENWDLRAYIPSTVLNSLYSDPFGAFEW